MLKVDEWAEIRRLHRAEGLSIKEITRRLGVARNTVRSALRSDNAPIYQRAPRGSRLYYKLLASTVLNRPKSVPERPTLVSSGELWRPAGS